MKQEKDNKDIIKETEDGKVIANPDAAIGWLERLMNLLEKHGPVRLIMTAMILVVVSIFGYFALNPEHIFNMYDEYKATAHQELIVQRMENTPKIQDACDELLLRSGADRVLFLELHNSTGNISGLPFYYASASCESLDDGVRPIADQYMEVKLSLVPFATELFKRGYWHGDMEELKQYDKSLYYRMMSNEAHHAAFMIVQGVDFPCGMLIVTYKVNPEKAQSHDCAQVNEEMERTSRKIAIYAEASTLK